MKEITVRCHCPEHSAVRILLDGEERTVVKKEPGQTIHIQIEQLKRENRPDGWELVKKYLGCVFSGRTIRYGSDVPSPFQAVFEADYTVSEDDAVLSFTLLNENGRYAIVPDGSTPAFSFERSYENNLDNGIWAILLAIVMIPLTIVFAAGMAALFIGENVPVPARILFGTLYAMVYVFVLISFFLKVRKIRRHG